jgi:protoheme IX farnesyltransferase
MTLFTQTLDAAVASGCRRAWDFVELTKPRIVLMVLMTTAVGFYLGSFEAYSALRLAGTLAGTALAAAGTLALNQLLERDVDGRMERTRQRPLPQGRVQPGEALVFGAFALALGLAVMAYAANALAVSLTTIIAFVYLFVYTPLKQKSLLCGVIGAVPGALPPVVGWAAAAGRLGVEAAVLFAILFLWQVPHTLAIASLYRDDFARAGLRFLPVVEPNGGGTGRQAVSHTLALLAVSLLPTLVGLAGKAYFAVAVFLGLTFVGFAAALAWRPSSAAAKRLLVASLFYLPVLLVAMALDRGGG